MNKEFAQSIARGLHLPSETLSTMPLCTLRGKESLTIENHRGIIAYCGETIRIAVDRGSIVVYGRDLIIAVMRKDCLTVQGIIRSVELE